jgi:integrase
MYKYSTQKNHRHVLTKYLPRFGDLPISEVTRQSIQAYVAQLTQEGYAPRSIDHIHDVLSALLRTAVKWGHLSDNPARGVDLPALRCVRPKWALSVPQACSLIGELPPLPKAMVGLALLSGLRRGELFALRWRDIDFVDRLLTVREAVYEGMFSTPKTGAGNRTLPLSDLSIAMLEQWRSHARRTNLEDLVFATYSGKPISPNNVLRRWVFPACDRLGLKRATWLTFRRTYSSWSHAQGVPGKVIAQLMGHAKVDTTLNVYTQVLDDTVREAVERVSGKLITIDHRPASGPTVTH